MNAAALSFLREMGLDTPPAPVESRKPKAELLTPTQVADTKARRARGTSSPRTGPSIEDLERIAYTPSLATWAKVVRMDSGGTVRQYPLYDVNAAQVRLFLRTDLTEEQAERLIQSLTPRGFLEVCVLLLRGINDARSERFYYRVESGDALSLQFLRGYQTLLNLYNRRNRGREAPAPSPAAQEFMAAFALSLPSSPPEGERTPYLSMIRRTKEFIRKITSPKASCVNEARIEAQNGGMTMAAGRRLQGKVLDVLGADVETETEDGGGESIYTSTLGGIGSPEEEVVSNILLEGVWDRLSPRAGLFMEYLMMQAEYGKKIMPRAAYKNAFRKEGGTATIKPLINEIKAAMDAEGVAPSDYVRLSMWGNIKARACV